MNKQVLYGWSPRGYRVVIMQNGHEIERYDAGNHQGESQTTVEPGSPHALRPSDVARFAKMTAAQYAKEHSAGVPHEDDDITDELLAEDAAANEAAKIAPYQY